MHHCLAIQEILRIIFSLIFESPGRSRVGNETLNALSITCHAFGEVALDIIWHTQVSLVPLIKCLPENLWHESPKIGFDRSLTLIRDVVATDFVRFDFYARRIRCINYMPYAWHRDALKTQYDLQALDILRAFRNTQLLFPNLRTVKFVSSQIVLSSCRLHTFLGKHLTSLSLRWSEHEGTTDPVYVDGIIRCSPNIEYLGIEQSLKPVTPKDCIVLSSLICSLKELRGLTCGSHTLDRDAILYLASLPHFEALRVPNSAEELLESIKPISSHRFPALRVLTLRVSALTSCSKLLSTLQLRHLHSITLNFESLPSSSAVHSFFSTLGKCCLPDSMRSIHLNHPWKSSDNRVFSTDVIIDGSAFAPLLAFKGLTKLEIGLLCSFTLDNAHIVEMAEAWPMLQRLQLGSLLGSKIPSGVTLDGLLPLVNSCPELEFLSVAIDASVLPPLLVPPSQNPANTRIDYLQVGDSAIEPGSAEVIAEFLLQVFPKILGIGGVWNFSGSGNFTHEQRIQHLEWQSVATLLGEMRRRKTARVAPA